MYKYNMFNKNNKFTTREQEVIELMCYGYTNPEIAEMLYITSCTAKAHVTSILKKLNVKNRTLAAIKYLLIKYERQDLLGKLQNSSFYCKQSCF